MVFCSCLLSLFLWLRVSTANADGWNNDVPASVVGLSGSCVEIPCTFSYPAKGKTYTRFTGVWTTGDYEPIIYHTDSSKITEAFKRRTNLTGDLHLNTCSLKISSLRNSDTGPFIFRIEIEDLDKYTYAAKKVSITVKESPEQPTVSVKDEVTSGKSVIATCTVLHSCPSDLPRITWSHDGSPSSPSQPQSQGQWKVTSYNLTFTPSREDHNTNLSCSADFRGKTVTGYKKLNVKYPPYDVNVVTKPSVKENDSAELTCSSNSNPPANSYQWFSLNGILLGNGPTYKLEKVTRHTEAISCTAINTVGRNSSGPRKIKVLYPPYDVNVVIKTSVKENDSAELTCSSNSNPPANSYQWFSLNGTLLGNGSTYKLEKVTRHTEAISCTAINTVGRNSSGPRKLNILYPPEMKNESSCQGAILTVCVCNVDSNPPSEVKWFGLDSSQTFPSSSIKQNGSLTIFTVQSWQGLPGTVQCFANNSLGSFSITLEAPQNGIIIYIAVASAILVVLFGVLVYVVRRHCGKRATQQYAMKNEQNEMKTSPKSKEEKGYDEDIYTNCPNSRDYDNLGHHVGPLSCDSALEDESVYANV
ncbi:myelin-associated glycoprotein [Siphateles boraxobius]|uniref:myelin-associated glycoprotein n=1 Tax=Siphateles boraxobius TaxID=180520 RepID=UPI004063A289